MLIELGTKSWSIPVDQVLLKWAVLFSFVTLATAYIIVKAIEFEYEQRTRRGNYTLTRHANGVVEVRGFNLTIRRRRVEVPVVDESTTVTPENSEEDERSYEDASDRTPHSDLDLFEFTDDSDALE